MASLVWGCCRLIGAMPHWLRYYVLQDTIYFIVYKCLRYRVGVVTENLRNSFPDRPMAEIKRIRRSFYHNLSEIFISTVSQAAMSDDDCRRRVRVKNLDEVLSDLRGRDALLSTAHFGCWEYDSFLALYTGEHYLAAVYHPLGEQGDRCGLHAFAPAAQHPAHPDEGDHPLLHRPSAAGRCPRTTHRHPPDNASASD